MNQQTKFPDHYAMLFLPFIALCVVSQLYIFLPVASRLSTMFNLAPENISILTSIFGIFYACGLLIWGILSDHYGRKKVMLFGLLMLAIITMAISFSLGSNFMLLLILRGLQGFFAASYPSVILAWISENLDISNRLKATSFVSCAFLLSGVIGQWFGDSLIVNNLAPAMLPLAAIYVFSALLIPFLKEEPVLTKGGDSLLSATKRIPSLLKHKALYPLYLSASLLLFSFVALYTVVMQFYQPQLAAIGLSAFSLRMVALPAMFTSLTAIFLIKRFKQDRIIFLALGGIGLTLGVQYYALSYSNQWGLIISHFFFVASVALCIPSLITAISTNAGQLKLGQ